jgi:excisionase family DNA binding protein
MIMEDQLCTVEEAAEFFGTSTRYPRRLVAERRIRFVRLGRLVRIPRSALEEFVASSTVEPMVYSRRRVS